jgi:VIT1/CCC1 family predicted Fe2+/Mn2+ transporter
MSTREVLSEVAASGAKDELTDYLVYKRLSTIKIERNVKLKKTLARLSGMERRHYLFWKDYCAEQEVKVSSFHVYMVIFLRYLLGVTFAVRYLERGEERVIRRYKEVAHLIPAKGKKAFNRMLADEVEHEMDFAKQFESPHIRYISFIVLGLADALVEIAGIHAGSLGIYNSTELAGLAGIVAGAAASIAMASAAYAQAKTGFKGSAALSAVYTGISYFLTAVVLATPYFLTKVMVTALFTSLIFAIILIGFISFYGSVIANTVFKKDFIEITGIMLSATVALYLLGTAIRYFTGMTI